MSHEHLDEIKYTAAVKEGAFLQSSPRTDESESGSQVVKSIIEEMEWAQRIARRKKKFAEMMERMKKYAKKKTLLRRHGVRSVAYGYR